MFLPARLIRAGHPTPQVRSFSIAIPARKEGGTGTPKARGFLAEYVPFPPWKHYP